MAELQKVAAGDDLNRLEVLAHGKPAELLEHLSGPVIMAMIQRLRRAERERDEVRVGMRALQQVRETEQAEHLAALEREKRLRAMLTLTNCGECDATELECQCPAWLEDIAEALLEKKHG